MKKMVVMVMAVVEVNGQQSVQVTIGLEGTAFIYLGSLNCNFEQYGIVHSYLKKVPSAFLDYRAKKWEAYIDKIMQELMKL